jgi:actin-like ATPase involved in cell morphogenesis
VSTEAQLRACIANAAEASCVVQASVSILLTQGPMAVTRNLIIRGAGNSIIDLNQGTLDPADVSVQGQLCERTKLRP